MTLLVADNRNSKSPGWKLASTRRVQHAGGLVIAIGDIFLGLSLLTMSSIADGCPAPVWPANRVAARLHKSLA